MRGKLAVINEERSRKGDYWEATDLTTTCAADLEGHEVPERKWLVEGCFPHENVTLLGGDGGLGKTILALMLGTSLSTRTDWLGFPAMQGPFLYVGAEDDNDEVHRRLDYMRSAGGYSWGDLADFHFKSLVGEDALLGVPERNIIRPTTLLQKIETRIEELGAIGCAIDTAADVFGGDESNRQQVRQFIGLLRGVCLRRKVTLILRSHPSVSGMASGSGHQRVNRLA
jgi:RecA-family ATPase